MSKTAGYNVAKIYLIAIMMICSFAWPRMLSAAPTAVPEKDKTSAVKENLEASKKEEEKDIVIVPKETRGTVSRVDAQSISVAYAMKKDAEYEMMIPFTEKFELRGYKAIKDIKAEDTVSLTYDEITTFKGQPEERREMKLKGIKLIKNAVKNALTSAGGAA